MSENTKSNEQLNQEIAELKETITSLEYQLVSLYNEKDVNVDSSLVTDYQQELAINSAE